MAVRDDQRRRPLRFLQVLGGEPAHAGARVIDHGAEGLIDFMGNGGGEFAQRRHPRHVPQLRLRLPQGLFGLLALGDVHHRSHKLEAARFIAYGMSHNVDIFDGTIRHQQATFLFKIFALLRRALEAELIRSLERFVINVLQQCMC